MMYTKNINSNKEILNQKRKKKITIKRTIMKKMIYAKIFIFHNRDTINYISTKRERNRELYYFIGTNTSAF